MDDTSTPGTLADGGPGWHIREPQPAPVANWSLSPPQPSAAQPAAVQPQPQVSAPASRQNARTLAIFGGALVLFAAAGGGALLLTGGHSPSTAGTGGGATFNQPAGNPQAVLASSVAQMPNLAYRADITITESLSLQNASGAQLGGVGTASYTIHLDHESASRSELRETFGSGAQQHTVIVVQYDGTDFVSTDNGATYQTFPASQAQSHELDPGVPVQFLTMVTAVNQADAVEINGVPATEYHADLDPVKLTNFLRGLLNAQGDALATKIADNTGGTDGSIDAYVDPNGHVLSDDGSWTDAVDLGAVDPQEAGATLNAQVSFQGAFSDYGSSVSVTRPVHVTGPSNLF